MILPQQYKNEKFRFIMANGKIPKERGWTNGVNYKYYDNKLLEHIKTGNYGVMGGKGNLLIIDFDSRMYQAYLLNKLPQTFTVKSGGKGLYHVYLIIDEPFPKFPIKDNNDNTLADMQCIGGQAIGVGSLHESGRQYKIANDVPISHIKTSELREIFGNKWIDKEIKGEYTGPELHTNPLSIDIREKLLVSEMLESIGVDTTNNPCKCPFHGMNGNGNLSYDDEKGIWNCFDCGRGGTIIHLWMYYRYIPYIDAIGELKEKMRL